MPSTRKLNRFTMKISAFDRAQRILSDRVIFGSKIADISEQNTL